MRVVFERRRVADLFFAGGDVAQQAAHDFAAARFGQGVREADRVGRGQGADLLADVFFSSSLSASSPSPCLERHEAADRLRP